MAQNLGQVERIALVQNCAKLPFRDEALAASCGLTVADMNELPVNNIAVNVVFDALAQRSHRSSRRRRSTSGAPPSSSTARSTRAR